MTDVNIKIETGFEKPLEKMIETVSSCVGLFSQTDLILNFKIQQDESENINIGVDNFFYIN